MEETAENINQKNIISLSRNQTVALVVGAAGFIGSWLVEHLLKKGILVIGIDNFSTGKRANLSEVGKQSNFRFLQVDAADLELNIDRVDYLFIATWGKHDLDNLFDLIGKHKPKVVFVSSIEAYQKDKPHSLNLLFKAEKEIARFAQDNKINARVVRLSSVYGPRMHFQDEALSKLLLSSLKGDLQKEELISEFSTRALFIDDAVELLIKSMLKGSTAMKIFDGALLHPIKLAEIKQVLLDPLWYENKGFVPSELPPWPTPNLEKTIKELSWKPQANLIKALAKTISFFKENEFLSKEEPKAEIVKEESEEPAVAEKGIEKKDAIRFKIPKINIPKFEILWISVAAVFLTLVIFPSLSFAWSAYRLDKRLEEASLTLSKGELDKSLNNVVEIGKNIEQQRVILAYLNLLPKLKFENLNQAINLLDLTAQSLGHTVMTVQAVNQTMKAVSGEINISPEESLDKAKLELAAASGKLAKAQLMLQDKAFGVNINAQLKAVEKGRTSLQLLEYLIAPDGLRRILVLIQDNSELRPAGGVISSYAQIDFENGKLKKIVVDDVEAVDKLLKEDVEPPKEIKEDLGKVNFLLADANWEADFPTSARQAEWFYTKETGQKVDGVIALDISAIMELLKVLGSVELEDEKITEANVFEKVVTGEKTFLTSLTKELFNKLLFLPDQNWLVLAAGLERSLTNKHISIYLNDNRYFVLTLDQNWASILPRPKRDEEGELIDFIAPVEANLGGNKANFYLERKYFLDTSLDKDGQISHQLKIEYINRSPSDIFPAGIYKNRFRLYLPDGAKLNQLLWEEEDMTKESAAFIDYGRTGYSMLLTLNPKEKKSLVLSYILPTKLQFKEGEVSYKLAFIKQPGTIDDPLEWKINYPLNYKTTTSSGNITSPNQHSISTDLSSDKLFQIKFLKY